MEDKSSESADNYNRFCGACGDSFPRSAFSKKQWKIKTWRRRCSSCTNRGVDLQDVDPSATATGPTESNPDAASIAVAPDTPQDIAGVCVGTNAQGTTCGSSRSNKNGFPIPPRPIAEIIGRVNASSTPNKKVVAELLHALKYEIESTEHQKVVELLASSENEETTPPITYETPSMAKFGATPLLFGTSKHDVAFEFRTSHLPKQEVNVLRDSGMGESDRNATWGGGDALILHFLANDEGGEMGRKRKRLHPYIVYVGECTIVKNDLWDFAIQARREGGRFHWPEYYAILQCPFCGELACPSSSTPTSSSNESHVMICQTIMQRCDDGTIPQRALPRLCCRSCFSSNHRPNGFDWGDYTRDSAMKHNLLNLHFSDSDPHYLHPLHRRSRNRETNDISAYTLANLFEVSGMCMAAARVMMEMLTSMGGKGTSAGTGTYKARFSKSMTKQNRQQPVVKFHVKKKRQCVACGILTAKASACSACQAVFYCGRDCQKRHWKRHKQVCGKAAGGTENGDDKDKEVPVPLPQPRPSSEIIIQKKRSSSNSNSNNGENGAPNNICGSCQKNADDDGGNPAMCVICGTFICCGPCLGSTKYNGVNGEPSVLSTVCITCLDANNDKSKATSTATKSVQGKPGTLLRNLLHEKPTGRHVNHARFILAQWMLNDTKHLTGIEQNVQAATEEYLWLANDCDYAPAQLSLGTFHDPSLRDPRYDGAMDGPTPLHEFDVPYQNPPAFPADARVAMKYYNRACAQKLSLALELVGTWYKNGEGIFPQDMSMAIKMLRDAADLGKCKAMANLARLYMKTPGSGSTMEALELFDRAAGYGNFLSMFTVAQFGMDRYDLREKGERYLRSLVDEGWVPPIEGGFEVMRGVCAEYGIEYKLEEVGMDAF